MKEKVRVIIEITINLYPKVVRQFFHVFYEIFDVYK